MYSFPLLTEQLAQMAEDMLPRFSGTNKVFQVIVQFNYGKFEGDHWLAGQAADQHIKIVFWHPNNAMLVGYNYETHVEDIWNSYIISANHSSTWKHDGLNFFHDILEEPKGWKIIDQKLLDVTDAVVDKEFTFTEPVVA